MLTRYVRVLSIEQAGRTWWPGTAAPERNALRAARRLERAGLVHCSMVNARPELDLRAPIAVWQVGQPEPNFGRIAYRLQSRWTLPLRRIAVMAASTLAARMLGGHGGPLTHPLQVSHDLHVAALFLRFRRERPKDVAQWIGERRLARFRRHAKLPDAALGMAPDRLDCIIEFGNGYDRNRVAAFHADCAERRISYELW